MADPSASEKPVARVMAVLHFYPHDGGEHSIKLRREATILGREKGDIILPDPEISSSHCQIQNVAGTFRIFDMNSTNGTFVNGNRVVKEELKDGDWISVGQTGIRFSIEDEAQVRHIATVFQQNGSETPPETRASLVDTLIESQLNSKEPWVVSLKIRYKDGTEEELSLPQQLIYVGRASSFGKFDQDPRISRKHLMIKLNNSGEVFIEDQGSTNGVFVDGVKVKGLHPILHSSVVKIGDTTIKISAKRKTA